MLGDWKQPEFASAIEYLRREAKLANSASRITGSKGGRLRPIDPDLILLVASRPSRFSAAEVESLQRRFPQTRLVALLGSWCEGEIRSGHPWPGVTRIYAHQWQARLPQELEIRRAVTKIKAKLPRRLVGIATAQYVSFAALAIACRSMAHESVWLPPNRPLPVPRVDAILYDATLELPAELAHLKQLREQLVRPPVVLLLDFPRPSDLELASQAGVSAVLARPYLLTDLAAELQRIMAPALARAVSAA
jgi:hypothetical protein